jgi:hypothetical protein
MKKIIFTVICVVMLAGCEDIDSKLQHGRFNELPRPVVVIACNEGGLAVLDGNQDMHSFHNSYYFVQPFLKSDFKRGHILLPVKEGIKK